MYLYTDFYLIKLVMQFCSINSIILFLVPSEALEKERKKLTSAKLNRQFN